jgi:serine/threonine-protein kinase ATR
MSQADRYREKYLNMPEDPLHSEHDQCKLLSAFGRIACASSRCLQAPAANSDDWREFTCIVCDATEPQTHEQSIHWDKDISDETWKDVIAALDAITQEDKFNKSSKPRVLMAIAIRRVFSHISDPEYLDLEISPLGKWLINAMTRSLRELRITAS